MKSIALQDLLEASVRRGQRRVALQRLMMMQAQAQGQPVPKRLRRHREDFRSRAPERELARMEQVALDWARMISGRRDLRWRFVG